MFFNISVKLNNKIEHIKNIELNLLGKHNVLNAVASIGVGLLLQLPINKIKKS